MTNHRYYHSAPLAQTVDSLQWVEVPSIGVRRKSENEKWEPTPKLLQDGVREIEVIHNTSCSLPINSSQNFDMAKPRDSEVINLKQEENGMNRLQNPSQSSFEVHRWGAGRHTHQTINTKVLMKARSFWQFNAYTYAWVVVTPYNLQFVSLIIPG